MSHWSGARESREIERGNLLSPTTLGRLFASNSLSASDSSEPEPSPVVGDFRFCLVGSVVVGGLSFPFVFQ